MDIYWYYRTQEYLPLAQVTPNRGSSNPKVEMTWSKKNFREGEGYFLYFLSELGQGFIRRFLKNWRDSNAQNFWGTEEVWNKFHFPENESFFLLKIN